MGRACCEPVNTSNRGGTQHHRGGLQHAHLTCPPCTSPVPCRVVCCAVPCAVMVQIRWRLSDEPVGPSTPPEHCDPELRHRTRTKIFLGYTSNLVSAGVREHIRWGPVGGVEWAGRGGRVGGNKGAEGPLPLQVAGLLDDGVCKCATSRAKGSGGPGMGAREPGRLDVNRPPTHSPVPAPRPSSTTPCPGLHDVGRTCADCSCAYCSCGHAMPYLAVPLALPLAPCCAVGTWFSTAWWTAW